MGKLSLFLLFSIGSLLLFPGDGFAQSELFSETFEGYNGWLVSGSPTPNNWIVDNCAGNGIAQTGTKAAYITSGGSIVGCGPTGITHYGYDNSASGSAFVVVYRPVNNSCFTSLEVTFDLKIDGAAGQDYAELVYSTDNGATWLSASAQFSGIATWQTQNVALPLALNNTSFWLGFRFTYDATIVSGLPAAVDNVVLEGMTTDTTPPTAICPSTFNMYANASCVATVPDLPASVTKSDNCTAVADLTVVQSPAIGSSASAGTTATITVTDQAGNQTSCNTTLVFLDTIRPAVTCPSAQTAAANNSCQFTLTNMTGLLTATDNCTSSGSLSFTQTPVPGINLAEGTHTITLYASDASGNSNSCQFSLTVEDTTAPVVTCPAYHLIPGNNLCIAHVGDLSGVPVNVTDNCTNVAALFSYSQIPAAISTFSDTIPATIFVADAAGNTGSCQLFLVASDTVAPIVTCLSDTTVFTTNPCNYFIPNLSAEYVATDVCPDQGLLNFSQSPVSGSPASGITTVTTIITDVYGNQGVCYTTVHPTDAIAPVITCPSNQNISNGADCYYTLQDYTTLATVNDNCSGYVITQTPVPTTIISAGTTTVTLTVSDAGSNQASCTFQLVVEETQAPSIACPPDMTSCDSIVTYSAPVAADNCLFAIVQTDNSGLTSGSVFPQGITVQTYTVTDSSGNSASCSFSVEVLEIPDLAVITGGDTVELCNQFSTTVSATAVNSGTGAWSVIQGTGVFANAASASTTASGLSVGTNKLMWSVNSPSCGTRRDTLIVIVWPLPSPAEVQDSLLACTEAGLFFHATVPQSGIGTWTCNSGIQFEDIHAPVTSVSNLNGGNHVVVWTVNSGTCPASSDTMYVVSPNIASIGMGDTTICLDNLPLQLTGSTPIADQQPVWSTASGEATFSSDYQSETTLTAASVGTVEIVYWLTDLVCGNTTDTLTLIVQDCNTVIANIPTMFTPNSDSKNDVFIIPQLSVLYPECRVEIYNRWGGLVYESDGYANAWDGTYKGESVPMGTYFYHIHLNNADDTRIEGSISIIR